MSRTYWHSLSTNVIVVAIMLACILFPGCGASPASPSANPSSSPTMISFRNIEAPGVRSPFGAGVPDLAVCLQAGQDPACFSTTRVGARTAAGATAPIAPTNLVATVSAGTVTLSWTAPASGDPVMTYVLEAGSSAGAANLANFSTGTTSTSFVAVGVGAGIYYVRIRAQNAGGTSSTSVEIIVIVGTSACTSAPNPPSGLGVTVSGGTVTFTWSAPAGGCAPTSYVVQAGSLSGISNLANSSTGSVSTSFIATGVVAGTYYLRVLAANGSGRSAASNEVVATVGTGTRAVDQFYLYEPSLVLFGADIGGRSLAQTFTVGISGVLSAVELNLIRGTTAPNPGVLMQIRRTSGGVPTSEVLVAVTIQNIPLRFNGEPLLHSLEVTVDLSGFGLRVQAGDRLAIVLPKGDRFFPVTWYGAQSGSRGYPGGSSFGDNAGTGTFSTDQSGDLFFRTYVSN